MLPLCCHLHLLAMKKIALLSTFASFFLCYMEWGANQSAFLFEAAYTVLANPGNAESNFSHPLILLPFVGLLVLLVMLFQKNPRRSWAITGLALPGLLVFFILLSGVLSRNFRIVLSTMPFIVSAAWLLRSLRN